MEIVDLNAAAPYDPARFVAEAVASRQHGTVRIIRLAPGQALPPHTHGASDLFLYVAEGDAVLETDGGSRLFRAGELAVLTGAEELRVSNAGEAGVTLLAFLAPPFPPAKN
ncbi:MULTISPECIES: cupin domain-containing protein [unclassified Agromyces]|uniref:cupin domain-containing protein n=1 Tax=unclassified Agromyces TaxID=2639701 RepID=UPI0030153E2C